MALSWIYVIWGEVPVVAGLFFGLKAAVLAVVIEAVLRDRPAGAEEHALCVVIAALAFVALFAFAVPFPLVVLAAALIGLSAAHRMRRYAVGGGHRRMADHGGDRLLGETMPSHATPTVGAPCGSRRSGCRSGWVRSSLLLGAWRARQRVQPTLRCSSAKWRWSRSAAPMRCSPTWRRQAVETYRWLTPGEMLTASAWPRRRPGR